MISSRERGQEPVAFQVGEARSSTQEHSGAARQLLARQGGGNVS